MASGLRNSVLSTAGRLKRIEALLNEDYREITVEKMIELISDRYCMQERNYAGWDVAGAMCVFQMWEKDELFAENTKYYENDKSAPVYACGGDLRIAMSGEVPAQKGKFKHMKL